MTTEAKRVIDLTTKTYLSSTDKILVVFNAANSTSAQTALVTANNLFANSNMTLKSNNFMLMDHRASDPANSTALTVANGTLFYTNSYMYVAIANNVLRRVALSDF